MTPALKAMVEAMAAELMRQGRAEPFEHVEVAECRLNVLTYEGAMCGFDLEKIARAGLEAIPVDVLARAIYTLDPQTEPGDPEEPNEPLNGVRRLSWDECDTVFCEAASAEAKAILDAILKEQP